MKTHSDDYRTQAPFKFGAPEFKMRSHQDLDGTIEADIIETCSFCGSMTVDDVIKYMQVPGTQYSGSDWKYSWPHKFYIEIPCAPYECCFSSRTENGKTTYERSTRTTRHHKFYSEHMADATPEQIENWNNIVAPRIGIKFRVDPERGVGWSAPCHGHQAYGVVS